MRRTALVTLVAAGLLAWLWTQSRPARDPGPSPASVAERAVRPPELREPAATAGEAAGGGASAAAKPETRAPLAPALESGPHFVLRVTDEHERPVAGVAVCFLDLDAAFEDSPWSELSELFGRDLDALCVRRGRELRTDADGVVRIARTRGGGIALASADGRAGWAFFGPAFGEDMDYDPNADEEQTLALRAELALDVRVLDGAGAPAADVPVALRLRGEDEVIDSFGARTDARGAARLAHLQVVFEDGLGAVEGACVALDMLAARPSEQALRPGADAPLELTLPPCGSLELQLVDASDQPLATDAWIELELAPPGPRDADEEWERQYLQHRADDRRQKVFARGGHALVQPIGLALELELHVQPTQGYRPSEQRARGPRVAGERALVRVPVRDRQAMLTGTLRTPEGEPFAERALEGSLWLEAAGGGRGRGLELRTDAGGRFELALDADWPLTGRFTLELHRDEPEVGRWSLRKEWQATLAPGANELGALAIAPLPVLAAGHVFDPTGAPLAGAHVALATFPEGGRDWITSAESDAAGRFRLQGIVAARKLELEFGHEGFSSRRLEVANGAQELVLTLSAGGGLEGSVQVNDVRALAALHATAASASGEVSEAELDEQGRFVFEDLAPGDYTVALVLAAEPEFECRVPGVRVEAGASASDPRLQGLDLRARLHAFELTLVHPEGETSFETFVRRRPAGEGRYADPTDWGRELAFVTSHPALDLRVTAEGCRTLELLGVSEDRTLELTPGYALRVVLAPPLPLDEHEWLQLQLEGLDGAPVRRFFAPRFWDGETAETRVPEPGRYRARITFLQQAIGDLRATPLELAPLFDVLARDEPQVFEITLPPAALAALAAARAAPPPR